MTDLPDPSQWSLTRRDLVRHGAAGASALSLAGFLAACGSKGGSSSSSGSAPAAQKKGGTLVFGVDSMSGNFDPGTFSTYADWMAIYVVGVGLTVADYHSPKIKPGLAESWEIDKSGTRYTFHLRKGLTFHDGSPVTAKDFERSWKRLFDAKDPTQAPGTFTANALLGQPVTKSDFKAVDDQTFVVNLASPDVSFLARCSTVAGVALSSEGLSRYGKKIGTHMVAAGPFKFASFTSNQNATFERFDGYYEGAPFLDKVIMQIIPDATAMTSALRSGSVQASDFVSLPSISALKQTTDVNLGKSYVSQIAWLNCKAPSLKDVRVRQAINYCLDRKTLIAQGFNGQATQPGYLVPMGDIGYDKSLESVSTQDLAKAKQLVQEAGATGLKVNVSAPNNRWWPTVSQIVSRNMQAIGLDPQIKLLEQLSFGSDEFDLTKHEMVLDSFSAIMPDPDDSCRSVFDPKGSFATSITAGDTLPTADRLGAMLKAAREETDPAKRGQLYVDLQKFTAEEQMVVTILAYTPAPAVTAKNLVGVNVDALSNYYLYPAKISIA